MMVRRKSQQEALNAHGAQGRVRFDLPDAFRTDDRLHGQRMDNCGGHRDPIKTLLRESDVPTRPVEREGRDESFPGRGMGRRKIDRVHPLQELVGESRASAVMC